MSQVIYMISESGAIIVNLSGNHRYTREVLDPYARAGYLECTREEYLKKRAWQRRQEEKEAGAEEARWRELEAEG